MNKGRRQDIDEGGGKRNKGEGEGVFVGLLTCGSNVRGGGLIAGCKENKYII